MSSLFKKKNFGYGAPINENRDERADNTQAMNLHNENEDYVSSGEVSGPHGTMDQQHESGPLAHNETVPAHPVHVRSTTLGNGAVPTASVVDQAPHSSTGAHSGQPSHIATSQAPADALITVQSSAQGQTSQQMSPGNAPIEGQLLPQSQGPILSFVQLDQQQADAQVPSVEPAPVSSIIQPIVGQLVPPAMVQAPTFEPVRRQRTPRPDGKVTLLAVVDRELHTRVKNAAKSHKVSLKTMVEMMIKTCFPTA